MTPIFFVIKLLALSFFYAIIYHKKGAKTMTITNNILIYELIKFTYNINNEPKIEMFRLKNAFNKLLEIIEENNHFYLTINFDKVLINFLDTYNQYFTKSVDNSLLIIKDFDFNSLEEDILSHHTLTPIDKKISEYIHSMDIYKTLNIKVKLSTIQEYLKLNLELLRLYQTLAWNEFNNQDNSESISAIASLKGTITSKFDHIDNKTQAKLKASLNSYNFLYSKDLEDPQSFEPWNIILFAKASTKTENLWKALGYYYIEYLNDTTVGNSPLELETSTIDTTNHDELNCDVDLFLIYYTTLLDKYLKNITDKTTKENLLIKKYLLLSLPETEKLSNYYLENATLDNFEIDTTPSWITNQDFETFLSNAFECVLSLDYTDTEIENKQYLEAKIITNALFIKSYLDLSINENNKNQIKKLITTSKFYHNPNYKIATNLIDDIIFNQNEELKK